MNNPIVCEPSEPNFLNRPTRAYVDWSHSLKAPKVELKVYGFVLTLLMEAAVLITDYYAGAVGSVFSELINVNQNR